jgi:hypothetical protein
VSPWNDGHDVSGTQIKCSGVERQRDKGGGLGVNV